MADPSPLEKALTEIARDARQEWRDPRLQTTSIMASVEDIRDQIEQGALSDGHHTFNDLYDYRMVYNAHAALGWLDQGFSVVRSWKHSDGELCFGGGWFIVVALLPTGQVSNHYRAEHWSLFERIPAVDLPPTYDEHTPEVALERMRKALTLSPCCDCKGAGCWECRGSGHPHDGLCRGQASEPTSVPEIDLCDCHKNPANAKVPVHTSADHVEVTSRYHFGNEHVDDLLSHFGIEPCPIDGQANTDDHQVRAHGRGITD